MPYLGDFLGALAREITISRMQADAEALRLAEWYARDPLLKHFPVPRFRLPTVNIRVPVAIEALDEARPSVDLETLKPLFDEAMTEHLHESKIRLSVKTRQRVELSVAATLKGIQAAQLPTLGIRAIAEVLADAAVSGMLDAAESPQAELKAEQQRNSITTILQNALVNTRNEPARLSVLVTQDQLREAGENVVQLDLNLGEDAVEWTITDADDPSSARLVSE
jgi:hypothetical protein